SRRMAIARARRAQAGDAAEYGEEGQHGRRVGDGKREGRDEDAGQRPILAVVRSPFEMGMGKIGAQAEPDQETAADKLHDEFVADDEVDGGGEAEGSDGGKDAIARRRA